MPEKGLIQPCNSCDRPSTCQYSSRPPRHEKLRRSKPLNMSGIGTWTRRRLRVLTNRIACDKISSVSQKYPVRAFWQQDSCRLSIQQDLRTNRQAGTSFLSWVKAAEGLIIEIDTSQHGDQASRANQGSSWHNTSNRSTGAEAFHEPIGMFTVLRVKDCYTDSRVSFH